MVVVIVFDVTPIAVSTSTRVARGEARSRAVDSTRARVPLAALPAGASLKVDMCSRDVVSRDRWSGWKRARERIFGGGTVGES